FLNLQGRNFFDFIDQGNQILSSTKSDIVIWGYEENAKIRLNFQIANQYVIPNKLSFSLLDGLFVPLNYFSAPDSFSESLLLLIYGIIIAAINPTTNEQKLNKPKLLQNIIQLLAQDTSQKDVTREFMPYIMNMLGKIYLCNSQNMLRPEDIEIIDDLFNSALKNKQYIRLPLYSGCISNNLGQLYEMAFISESKPSFEYLKKAISYYQEAKKYLNRTYPYDYALISYHLACLYFEYWKHTNDLQALRDAVFQLRETEKVYSYAQFPHSWCHIEGLLGYYLTSLGMTTSSNEIMQLAISSYKNQQKFYEQHTYPIEWAKIQNEIGNIFYLLGKQNEDDNFMLEARNYFNSALEIYEQLKYKVAIADTQKQLSKVANYID
ncbi:MAG: hypothetical protein ILA52_00870, partial [Alphaproteobacteria bacterium]|nr:hypothetical protein [Alphaproteobacteria bacterium]